MTTSIYTETCHWCDAILTNERPDDMHCSPQCIEWTRRDEEDRRCLACNQRFAGPIHGNLRDGRGYCSGTCEYIDREGA